MGLRDNADGMRRKAVLVLRMMVSGQEGRKEGKKE